MKYSHPVPPVNFGQNPGSLVWRVTSIADGSRVFNSMKSEWKIRPDSIDPLRSCIVDYKIEMEFSSSIYSGITSKFFDFLIENINKQFEERCAELTRNGKYTDEIIFIDDQKHVV